MQNDSTGTFESYLISVGTSEKIATNLPDIYVLYIPTNLDRDKLSTILITC